MKKHFGISLLRFAIIGVALALIGSGAYANKPDWAGNKNKNGKGQQEEKRHSSRDHDDDTRGGPVAFGWSDDDRRSVSEYYKKGKHKGKCPPGLAKKKNGCLPPGQAKKWHKGKPLDKEVIFYELPKELRVKLPAPPPKHRYVQVAGDILMIAVGTGMVVDAIEDILK